jgi:hypothetical protein
MCVRCASYKPCKCPCGYARKCAPGHGPRGARLCGKCTHYVRRPEP